MQKYHMFTVNGVGSWGRQVFPWYGNPLGY
jgi:hypothetical protein